MGREADRGRVRLQPEHREALLRARRLDALPQVGAGEGAERARRLVANGSGRIRSWPAALKRAL
jgi:hypothetical protein